MRFGFSFSYVLRQTTVINNLLPLVPLLSHADYALAGSKATYENLALQASMYMGGESAFWRSSTYDPP